MIKQVIAPILASTVTLAILATVAVLLSRTEASHHGKEVSQFESVSITAGFLIFLVSLLLGGVILYLSHRHRTN